MLNGSGGREKMRKFSEKDLLRFARSILNRNFKLNWFEKLCGFKNELTTRDELMLVIGYLKAVKDFKND